MVTLETSCFGIDSFSRALTGFVRVRLGAYLYLDLGCYG